MDDAFLRAIRADPEADLPRLVYADWLDEHDDPARAEFVRVQCELAKLADHDDAYAALEDREHELLAEHEAKWLGDGPTPDEWTFRRGFVDEVRLDPADPPPGDWLTRQAVTSVTLAPRSRQARAERVVTLPGMEGLREVDAGSASGVWGLDHLHNLMHRWNTPGGKSLIIEGLRGVSTLRHHFSGTTLTKTLRRLSCGGNSLSEARVYGILNVAELAAVLGGSRLEELAINDQRLLSVAPLLNAGFAGSLTSLDVSYNPLAADAYCDFVAASPRLKLEQLDVSGTVLCGPTLRNLLAARCCETLTGLAINDTTGNISLEWVTDSPYWEHAKSFSVHGNASSYALLNPLTGFARRGGPASLRSLDLGDAPIGTDGARLLSEARWMRHITWLNLASCSLDVPAVWHLARPGSFPYLRTLHLGHNNRSIRNPVDDTAVSALIGSPTLARLRLLTLTADPVTDYGVELLMNAPHFMLSGLGLSRTQITAGGVRTLAKSPRLARLNWLDLSDNAALHSDALLPLAESPYLSPLCDLDISRTGASDAVRDLLRQRLGRRLLD